MSDERERIEGEMFIDTVRTEIHRCEGGHFWVPEQRGAIGAVELRALADELDRLDMADLKEAGNE